GMKIILDHVNNHIGIYHPWIKNTPFAGWINGTAEKHKNTIHYNSSNYDIHADSSTRIINNQGWFVNEMPDLNQRNPFLARYLIQNTLWWIETAGLDGIREDTYPYSDQQFLSRWAKEILEVYPDFNIVGEVWMGDPAFLAPYQAGSPLHKNFDTHLPSVTDFAFNDIVREALRDSAVNMRKIYDLISKDYLYSDPSRLVTFVDNHDISRIIYDLKGDFPRFKLAMTLLLTCRGIPQLYYGTELGIEGGPDHGSIRADFPGGFKESSHNAFLKEGRTQKENQYYDYLSSMIALRKKYISAIGSGRMVHFPVHNNIYFYLRDAGAEKILVILNGRNEKQKLDISLAGIREGKLVNAVTGEGVKVESGLSVEVPAMGAAIYELK
ncbi:MAG: alpha-amylase family glycosyl hydrolase, partial [Syntrophothermus sp.]